MLMESQGELLGEFSKSDIKILKGIAILFMMMLHLFCKKNVNGLYETFPMISDVPSIYYYFPHEEQITGGVNSND
jgi:hypothetical protein